MIVAPSVLTSNLADLATDCKEAVDAGLNWLHLDVMDGNFVPNLTFGPPVIRSLRKALGPDPVFDVHLMIENAEDCFQDYIDAGCNHLSVHVEAVKHLHRLSAPSETLALPSAWRSIQPHPLKRLLRLSLIHI